MTQTVIIPFLAALVTAVLSIIGRKWKYRDQLSLAGNILYLAAVLLLNSKILTEGALTYQAGGWPAPYGITFIADPLAGLMLLMTAAVSLAVNLYSWGYIEERGKQAGYYAFFHFMVTGMTGAFTTGDLFNLFVMFEIVLMSSYAMVAYTGTKKSLFTTLKYVILNIIGSSLMLIAIGGLYSVTGTLNMARMAELLTQAEVNMFPVLGLTSILFCVFALKSGLVPFHFWAPPVYTNSPPPAAAMMAGLSKKVGIYAVIRLYLTVFSSAKIPETAPFMSGRPVNDFIAVLMMTMAVLTVLLGGLSALNRDRISKLLSYSSVGQVGFIFIPIAIATTSGSQAAVSAALVYMVGHALAKPSLFMISGLIKEITGTTDIRRLGGISESSFLISAAFFISAFSLVGVPPLIGFFGKLLVFRTAIVYENLLVILVLLFGAVTTLFYMGKAWLRIFYGEPVEFTLSQVTRKEVFAVMILVVLIVVSGIYFEPLYQMAEKAAEAALNTEAYVETVLGEKK